MQIATIGNPVKGQELCFPLNPMRCQQLNKNENGKMEVDEIDEMKFWWNTNSDDDKDEGVYI